MTAPHNTGRRARHREHRGVLGTHAICRPTTYQVPTAGAEDTPSKTASGRYPESPVDAFCGNGPVTDAMVRAAREDMLRRCGFIPPPGAGFGVPPRHCTLSRWAARSRLARVPR